MRRYESHFPLLLAAVLLCGCDSSSPEPAETSTQASATASTTAPAKTAGSKAGKRPKKSSMDGAKPSAPPKTRDDL